MDRRRTLIHALLCAVALGTACDLARAEAASSSETGASPYTLEVESDTPDVVSFEALAARIGADLGAVVVRPGGAPASRAAISIGYRGRELVVRAVHAGGRVLERTVHAEGDGAAVQREAVLLAGNLARDEAREILDALAARPAPAPPPSAPPSSPPSPPAKRADEGSTPISVAFLYPLATNFGRPNIRSNVDLSLLYGRVGKVEGVQLGSAVVHASRGVDGAQLAAAVGIAEGNVEGLQLSGGANLTFGDANGVQLGGGANVAVGNVEGAQVSGALNYARGKVGGLMLAGGGNVAFGEVTGAQIASANVAPLVSGLQLGVVNVGKKVRGLQLGVINVAEEVDGASIGVISITKGGIHPIAWTSSLAHLNAGMKFSTKYVYTLAAVHTGTIEGDYGNVGITTAIGGHIPLGRRFDIEIQGAVSHLLPRPSQSSRNGNIWLSQQVMLGYSVASHFRVFAGVGYRQALSVDIGRDVTRPEVLAGVQF